MRYIVVFLLLVGSALANTHVVAKTLWLEARSEGTEGLMAVASVIQTRAEERSLSQEEVCLQRKQFSCWNNKQPKDVRIKPVNEKEEEIWKCCLRLEEKELGNRKWNQYYNPDLCSPSWGKKMKNRKRIGRHIFGRL